MKRRFPLVMLLLALLLVVALTFTACGDGNDSAEGSDETSSGIGSDYSVDLIAEKLDALRTEQGLCVKLHIVSTENGTVEEYDLVYAADGNVYYFMTQDDEVYLEFRESALTVYDKEDGAFKKTVMSYGAGFTKEQAKTMADGYAAILSGYFGAYRAYISDVPGMTVAKSAATVAGRACDKYTFTATVPDAKASIEICIDRATGACLKLFGSASAADGSSSGSVECTQFTTPYTVTLPDVNATDGRPQGEGSTGTGESGQGTGTGTGESGQGTGTGTGESGQGTGTGTGESGHGTGTGTGESGQGTDTGTTVVAVYPDVASTLAFERLVARGLEVSVSMTAPESEKYAFVYGESSNVIYFDAGSGNQFFYDVSEEDYFDVYVKQEGVWTAVRGYYADDDSEYENRAELIESMRSVAYSLLLLNQTDAERTGMQKSSGTYLDRPVDVFTKTDGYTVYTIKVDQTTGLVLSNRYSITVDGRSYFLNKDATAFATGVTYTLPDVTVVDPHEGGGEDLVAITDDFDPDETLAWVMDPELDGFYIAYQVTETLTVEFSMKDDVFQTYNSLKGVYTADLRDETKAVMYEETEEAVYVSEIDYEEAEMTREDVLNDYVLPDFFEFALRHAYCDDASFTKTAFTYSRLDREAYLYQNDETQVKYIIDAETGVCLLYQDEWDTFYCIEITVNIPDIFIPIPTPEE